MLTDRFSWGALFALVATLGSATAGAQTPVLPCDTANGAVETLIFMNGDDVTQQVSLAPVFTPGAPVRFAGSDFTQMFINSNGNVTFGAGFTSFTPSALPGLALPTLAPFFADVNLTPSGRVLYCVDAPNGRVLVTYEDVGYFGSCGGPTSRFQVALSPGTVCGQSGLIVEYRFEEMTWNSGTFGGGVPCATGLCSDTSECTPGVAGVDYGDGVTAVQLPGSLTPSVHTDLLGGSNVGTPGLWRIEVNPVAIPTCGDGAVDSPCEECDDSGESATCDADCTLASCGDGELNASAGEVCDDGGETATCDLDCTLAACGDGDINAAAGEECDDGNTTPGDGCDASCQDEPICGDTDVESPEVCDDGNTSTETECAYGTATCTACSADCSAELSLTGRFCGDGATDGGDGEACDDGNLVNLDGCSDTCAIEAPVCGNGVVQPPEACDDSVESATCDADCTAVECGDGVTNATAGEACDDGGESVACDADCSASACGDGVQNLTAGESCDDGNTAAGDGCSETCVSESCGNSIVDSGEECDDGGASETCDDDCTVAMCGDAVTNAAAGEECDGPEQLCDPDCTTVECGDGYINEPAGEGCDDGNTASGDGCSSTCTLEGAADAGVLDAGVSDAGTSDAGVSDAGASDAAPPSDGGGTDAGPTEDFGLVGGACSCRAGARRSAPALGWALALLGLVFARRGRRSRGST